MTHRKPSTEGAEKISTDFLTKCEILSEVHLEATWNIDLDNFREYNDLGLPLAYSVDKDLIEIKEGGKDYIEETWKNLCEILGVDKEDEFEDSDDMLQKSPLIQKLINNKKHDINFARVRSTYNFLDKLTEFVNSKTFDSNIMSNLFAILYFMPFIILFQVIWYVFQPEYFHDLSILFTLLINIPIIVASITTSVFIYIFLARQLNKRNFKKYSSSPSEQQKMQLRKWTF